MSTDDWTLVILVVVANVAFIGFLIHAAEPWKKQPKPMGRARTEYGRGVVPSAMQNDMMDGGA